jgi:hypothetical protein
LSSSRGGPLRSNETACFANRGSCDNVYNSYAGRAAVFGAVYGNGGVLANVRNEDVDWAAELQW